MLVDSSVLIEVLLKRPLADKCLERLKGDRLYVPSLVYYECYKKLRAKVSESDALEAMGTLEIFSTVNITKEIALYAADLAIEHNLAMADSLVLACARELHVPLLTLDNDFAGISGVQVVR